jgi:isochorismate synthase
MKFMPQFDYTVFDSLIAGNVRFAVYRPARQQDIDLTIQASPGGTQPSGLQELNAGKGFVIAPFRISPVTPVVLIRPDVQLTGEKAVFGYLSEAAFAKNASDIDLRNQSAASSFEQYSSSYRTFYAALEAGGLQKLVLSRTFDVERGKAFSAGAAFHRACIKYGTNFVFLYNTPETGAWMGVSPELLVSEQDGIYKTVALAGTRKPSTVGWDDKNRREQQIVADYMERRLGRVSDDVTVRGPFTAQAGGIEHLKTKFTFGLKDGYRIGDVLDLLHPSPAVCGFPKETAFDFILRNELYARRYYSGFAGPLNIDGGSRLYVNLRCMQIGATVLRLYAGGGILTSSELKSEWDETENKLQTILSVIETPAAHS